MRCAKAYFTIWVVCPFGFHPAFRRIQGGEYPLTSSAERGDSGSTLPAKEGNGTSHHVPPTRGGESDYIPPCIPQNTGWHISTHRGVASLLGSTLPSTERGDYESTPFAKEGVASVHPLLPRKEGTRSLSSQKRWNGTLIMFHPQGVASLVSAEDQ